MSSMLASDLANPAFVGATNPDRMLHVEFYWHEPIDKWESDTQGKPVKMKAVTLDQKTGKTTPTGENVRIPYIRIMRPGDNTSIIETGVRDDHKKRWPTEWLQWQIKEGMIDGATAEIPGWKIEDWEELGDDQKRELKFLRFHTVELIAGASDAQVQRMGIGGMGLREKAIAALKIKMGAMFKAESDAKDAELAELKARLDKLEGKPQPLGLPKKG